MMTIIVVTLMMAHPLIALAVNQMVYPLEYDPEQSYTDEECAEMFDPYTDRENFFTCSGQIGGGPNTK